MICPFQDPASRSLCLVLRIAGDVPPLCTKELSDSDRDREYRRCGYYGTAILGGLERILQLARRDRDRGDPEREAAA
ncbi:MAG: hypothetical protein OEW15_15075 [Nitrospirota bacterium]|nr:hypothetical protein [Nitrospirota bacterium]